MIKSKVLQDYGKWVIRLFSSHPLFRCDMDKVMYLLPSCQWKVENTSLYYEHKDLVEIVRHDYGVVDSAFAKGVAKKLEELGDTLSKAEIKRLKLK